MKINKFAPQIDCPIFLEYEENTEKLNQISM